MSKIQFVVYMHEDSMECEIEENLEFQEGLKDHPDIKLIAKAVADYTYEVGIKMEWDIYTKKLSIVGIE